MAEPDRCPFSKLPRLYIRWGQETPRDPQGGLRTPWRSPPLDDVQDPPNYQHTENHEEIEAGTLHQGVWIAQKAPDPGSRLDIYKAHGEDKTRQITNIPKIMRKSRLAPSIGESEDNGPNVITFGHPKMPCEAFEKR